MGKSNRWPWRRGVALGLLALLALVSLILVGAWLFLRASLPQLDGVRQVAGLAGPVTVTRDASGVPLLTADTRSDLAYATGFIHAQDRFFQMDLLRRSGAGELAELFGIRALPLDRSHRLHRFRARAMALLATMPADDRRFLERYAAGVNDGLHGLSARPFEYALIGATPRPWQAADSLLVVWAMYFDLQGMQEARKLARGWIAAHSDADQRAFLLPQASQWDVPLDASSSPLPPAVPIPARAPSWWGAASAGAAAAAIAPARNGVAGASGASRHWTTDVAWTALAPAWLQRAYPHGDDGDAKRHGNGITNTEQREADQHHDAVGSNNWALAGSRSANGGAIVANDMHLGLQLPAPWYRLAMQYRDDGGRPRRLVGLTLPGAPPVLTVGSNGHVAWAYTNAYGDFLDLVDVQLDPADPDRVRSAAGMLALRRHAETILVKGAQSDTLVVRDTALGPLRTVGGHTYALHWIAHDGAAINLRHRLLEQADSVAQALAVAASIGIPAQNFVAGDDRGHIGWTITGPLPRRPLAVGRATVGADAVGAAGAVAKAGALAGVASPATTAGQVPAPAPASSLALGAERAATWDGVLAPAAYPRLIDPPGGQISTANNRQLAGPGAALIGDGGNDLGARNRQIGDALQALGAHADIDAVYGVMLDDRAIFIDRWRRRALATLDADAVRGKPQRAQFARLLRESWSGRASVDSSGYRLARAYMWALYDLAYGSANAAMARLDARADMAMASARWPAVLERLLDTQPPAWLPPAYANWRAFELAAIDRVIAQLDAGGTPLAAATWGRRNTAAIIHPLAAAAPVLKPWLSAPPDQLPGDANMPRVASSKFGQSERLVVSPGHEEQGVFDMPGGQSGHPLSPYFLRGHADWVAGRTVPLLPGPATHTLRFVRVH